MKKKILLFVLFLFFALLTPGFAELYRYIDENGVTRFTDSYAEIPPELRNTIVVIEGEPLPDIIPEDQSDDAVTVEEESDTNESDINSEKITEDQLKERKIVLEAEFEALTQERISLVAEKENLSREEYNEKVNDLNVKIKAYEERNEAFNKLVDQYNKELVEQYLKKNETRKESDKIKDEVGTE